MNASLLIYIHMLRYQAMSLHEFKEKVSPNSSFYLVYSKWNGP